MIDKLELLLALARERHFGRAAERPALRSRRLSSALKSLEDQFGVLIVERGSRFRCFTPEGERMLDWARRIVGDSRAMRQEIDALKKGLSGHLRLAVIPTALPFVDRAHVAHAPALSGRSPHRPVDDARTLVMRSSKTSRSTSGISYVDTEPPAKFEAVASLRGAVRAARGARQPLAKREQITWAEAGKLPLCLLTPDMQNRRLIDRHLAGCGRRADADARIATRMLVLYAHVRTGEWASILPARLAETLDRPSRLRPISLVQPTVTHKIGLIVTRREPHSPLVAAFIAHAKRIANPTEPSQRRQSINEPAGSAIVHKVAHAPYGTGTL